MTVTGIAPVGTPHASGLTTVAVTVVNNSSITIAAGQVVVYVYSDPVGTPTYPTSPIANGGSLITALAPGQSGTLNVQVFLGAGTHRIYAIAAVAGNSTVSPAAGPFSITVLP